MIHGTSGDTLLCLKIALVRGVLYFREQGDAPSQNLATFNRGVIWVNTTPVDISRVLKYAVRFLGPSLGFTPKEISLKSLRKAGARAILCSGVKTNIIKLMGRWRSHKMLQYLHVQSEPLMRNFAKRIVQFGNYCLHPNHELTDLVPCY